MSVRKQHGYELNVDALQTETFPHLYDVKRGSSMKTKEAETSKQNLRDNVKAAETVQQR